MDSAIQPLMDQGRAMKTMPCQLPESSPGFLLLCKVTDENPAPHSVSFAHTLVPIMTTTAMTATMPSAMAASATSIIASGPAIPPEVTSSHEEGQHNAHQ